MTVSLDNNKDRVISQVKAGIGALRKSTTSWAIAGFLITFVGIISGSEKIDKYIPLLFFGSLTQVKQQSEKRHNNNESSQKYIASKVNDLDYKLKASEYHTRHLETDVANNSQQIEVTQTQVAEVAEYQKLLLAQLEAIKGQLDRQLLSISSQINDIEGKLGNYLPKSHLAPFRDSFSRLRRQYLEIKLRTPDNLELLQKLQLKLDNLDTKVATLNQKQSERIPTANECKEIKLPAKKPVRPIENKVGIFVDGTNISICASKPEIWNCRLDWGKLLTLLHGQSVYCDARFYDSMSNVKAGFLHAISKRGYEVISKPIITRDDGTSKGNLDTELSNDVMACAHLYDTFVLATCDGDFTDTIIRLRAMGKRVEVVSFKERSNRKLIKSADSYLNLTPLKESLSMDK